MWSDGLEIVLASLRQRPGEEPLKRSTMSQLDIMLKQVASKLILHNINWPFLHEMHDALIRRYLVACQARLFELPRNELLLQATTSLWAQHRSVTKWFALLLKTCDPAFKTTWDVMRAAHLTDFTTLTAKSLRLFKSAVVDPTHEVLITTVLELVTSARSGGIVDLQAVKAAVELYRVVSVVETDAMASLVDDLDVAKRVIGTDAECSQFVSTFCKPYVRQTKMYYTRVTHEWQDAAGVVEYVARAHRTLCHEDVLSRAILPPAFHGQVFGAVRKVIISNNIRYLVDGDAGVAALLACVFRETATCAHADDSRVTCFAQLYQLALGLADQVGEPLANVVAELVRTFQDTLTAAGLAVVQSHATTAPESKSDRDAEDKTAVNNADYVERLHALWSAAFRVYTHAMQGSSAAFRALTNGMMAFLNHHPAHPEILATYADMALHGKRNRDCLDEHQIDDAVTRVVDLLPFLSAKDCFREFYASHLARRLLLSRSASMDAEKASISKMKKLCGPAYTAKIESMCTDFGVGQGIEQSYRDFAKLRAATVEDAVDFSATVLKSGVWPHFIMCSTVTLPSVMGACAVHFNAFFTHANASRQLAWAWSLGAATVDVQFTAARVKLVTTTLQAVVLLHLQTRSCTVAQLATITGIDLGLLRHVVGSMATVKGVSVLSKTPAGPRVAESDVVGVDWSYKTPKKQLTLPAPKLSESLQRIDGSITEERKLALDAAIVRTMKARLTMQHSQLVEEVVRQIRYFQPEPRLIKQRIEDLIGRRYLGRQDPMDPTAPYVYVAGDDAD